ncbi:TPA: hypothetical protein N0F65_008830 [Lagenidium giganteum]|uniref:PiggyBac transposable element-derived protein domain-containing protein n=1 Tax=Lagenidium giganteum TaxID=4803 RepID=A0AAV2YWC1_9STRA|nr:TPA: hypothetical protein N0F65_008830 [Lagenidium giganteum]
MKTGHAAVVRNLRAVSGRNQLESYLVVTDRFYTSVALAIQLLAMKVYLLRTCMTNRLGFCQQLIRRQKHRGEGTTRGAHVVVQCNRIPQLQVCVWWDNLPMRLLCTGGSAELERVARRERDGSQVEVPCPKFVKDYQRLKGGVDIHDQLRLQRYSLQMAIRYQQYYKSLFFGLFMKELHLQLLQLTHNDTSHAVLGAVASPQLPPVRRKTTRVAVHDEWQDISGSRKRRQRSCKLCSLLRGYRERGFQTAFFCEACSDGDKRVYLCPKARRSVDGNRGTCHDI